MLAGKKCIDVGSACHYWGFNWSVCRYVHQREESRSFSHILATKTGKNESFTSSQSGCNCFGWAKVRLISLVKILYRRMSDDGLENNSTDFTARNVSGTELPPCQEKSESPEISARCFLPIHKATLEAKTNYPAQTSPSMSSACLHPLLTTLY